MFRAIDSVIAQTLPVDEIIVVDDGSTDGTMEAIRSHYGSRVNAIRQENSGVSAARSRAVSEARSDWVAFLDSDDIWLPTKLERQFDALSKLGGEFGACITNCDYFGDAEHSLTVFEEGGLKTDSAFGQLNNPIKYILGTYAAIYVQSLVVLRSLIKEVGGFDTALSLAEDRDLIFRLAFKTKFCFVSTPLVGIDRTPAVSRLTGLLEHKSDQSYGWLELVREKWLAHPNLVDRDTRQALRQELIALYYSGAVERLRDLRLAAAMQKIHKIKCMGQSYPEIGFKLLSRAAKKLSHNRSSSPSNN